LLFAFPSSLVDIIVDETRRNLYTLSLKNVITAFSLGELYKQDLKILARNDTVREDCLRHLGFVRAHSDY